jgi:hypothetical protein
MAHQSSTAPERCATGVTTFAARLPYALVRLLTSIVTGRAANVRASNFRKTSSSRETAHLTLLSYCYRFVSNFAFLAVVYFTLNFITKYEERTIIAALVLAYAAMRVASALRQFHFFSRIERLETEARTAFTNVIDSPGKKQALREVATLRHQGELKAYMDLLFLGLIALLCVAKIVSP